MTITFPLPTELQGVGRVVGRFIVVTPDTVNDVDVYPEARGATGSVTFTPATKLSKTAARWRRYRCSTQHPSPTCRTCSTTAPRWRPAHWRAPRYPSPT